MYRSNEYIYVLVCAGFLVLFLNVVPRIWNVYDEFGVLKFQTCTWWIFQFECTRHMLAVIYIYVTRYTYIHDNIFVIRLRNNSIFQIYIYRKKDLPTLAFAFIPAFVLWIYFLYTSARVTQLFNKSNVYLVSIIYIYIFSSYCLT